MVWPGDSESPLFIDYDEELNSIMNDVNCVSKFALSKYIVSINKFVYSFGFISKRYVLMMF